MKDIEQIALEIATKAHEGQMRKGSNTPYLVHPKRVAAQFEGMCGCCGPFVRAAALLHDVVEDTEITLEELREAGLGDFVVNLVDDLTRRTGESYLDFILRIKQSYWSTLLKIADIKDNLSDLKSGSLKDKYEMALHILAKNI